MPRIARWPVLLLAPLAVGCGRAPQPAPTPLDELAAKPAEVRAKLDQAQHDQAEALKRAESESAGAQPDAESRR